MPPSPCYGLHQDGTGIGVDGVLNGLQIAEGRGYKTWGQGTESPTVFFCGGERDHGNHPSVKVFIEDDDLLTQGANKVTGSSAMACRLPTTTRLMLSIIFWHRLKSIKPTSNFRINNAQSRRHLKFVLYYFCHPIAFYKFL